MNKVAIPTNGGFFLSRLPHVRRDIRTNSVEGVSTSIRQLVRGHFFKLAGLQKTNIFSLTNESATKKRKERIFEPNVYAQHYRLVTGDADFVPAKLVRHEGCQVILDPLYQTVSPKLFERIDGLDSGVSQQPTGQTNVAVQIGDIANGNYDD